jgi:hypothetical protein
MRRIEGHAKAVRDVLSGKRYSIDYYQREYRWQYKQVKELMEDLSEQFLSHYDSSHEREAVAEYGHYFLGSIILSQRESQLFIVDGQQRLTTLTLLLMLLQVRQGDRPDRVKLEDLIYVEKYGKRSFNIAVPERAAAMEALFKGETPDVNAASESVQTIVNRFNDLGELLDETDIDAAALPFFSDWLIDNVHLVEITAANDEDAYTIFETMNDRGLSLSPLDMLKGFLLSNITDADKRNLAATSWRERIESLGKLGKEEDSDAVKAWLRGRHAQSVRERKRGSENQDFEKIGTEFHRWVGDHEAALGIGTSAGCFALTHDEMPFYLRHYERLRKAAQQPTPGLEPVYHVACFNFTLQYPMLLAALERGDSPTDIDRKIRIVARFLDILLARRAVNYLSLTFSALNYTLFGIIKELRGRSPQQLAELLTAKLADFGVDFDGAKDGARKGMEQFSLNQWSKRYIKVLLARMTAWVEQQSGQHVSVADYLVEGKGRFEVEHIWADKPRRHSDEFGSAAEFAEYRNRFGGLLLLPKSFNASYGALAYEKQLPHYLSQNLLARSLHPQCYSHNPGFVQFVTSSRLPFVPHEDFRKSTLEQRGVLYHRIAGRVWNPDDLMREVAG